MSFFSLKIERDETVSIKAAVAGALAIALTQASDLITTIVGLGLGGEEVNGFMNSAYQNYGNMGLIAVKLIATPLIVAGAWRRRYAPWVIASMFAAVSVWNLTVISQLR
jgi:hypothetical protein